MPPREATPVDTPANSRSLLDVSRHRHSSLLFALVVVLGAGLWTAGAAPRSALASADAAPHGDVLTASQHVAVGVVARAMRAPLPCTATSRSCDALATIVLPLGALGQTPAPHCPTPLYALLGVYRL
jgi:hypothetical protein